MTTQPSTREVLAALLERLGGHVVLSAAEIEAARAVVVSETLSLFGDSVLLTIARP